jgi:hypothetical protein
MQDIKNTLSELRPCANCGHYPITTIEVSSYLTPLKFFARLKCEDADCGKSTEWIADRDIKNLLRRTVNWWNSNQRKD